MYAIIFHAHQKLDRTAYRHLKNLLPPGSFFPGIRQILKFEAGRGPDSVKLKRHAEAEQPWHFVNPLDDQDTQLHQQIERHYRQLIEELKRRDSVRTAFEAAWLAHALVDGLTPAHHFPYESELEELRGEPQKTPQGLIDRAFVKSDTIVETLHKSLKLIGPRGLLTSHAMFEAGAYAIIAPLRLNKGRPSAEQIKRVQQQGIVAEFKELAREVALLNLYGRFCESGWIQPVIRDVRNKLAPYMVQMVTLAWYAATQEAAL